jgi:archaemetzincin
LSTDVLRWSESRLPADAFCLLAVTMEDLYPDESWNFVFGQASLSNRTGVYSFARYVPGFLGQAGGDDQRSLMLLRSCKVLAHETGHMFGIKHCVFFHCLMNGSNHLDESDQQPVHLCPVCLRKLQSAVGFDVIKRYAQLQEFSNDATWDDEARWLRKRAETLKAP